MRRCFLHIGTHKTGTTALQIVLNRHRAELQRQNYLYPGTGRAPDGPDGHHNIAWEISGDRRFRPEYGTLADVLALVGDAPHDVILSSEDFECSLFHRERFAEFLRRLRSSGLAVTIIVYLRNQVDYAQSLYQTMLHYGVTDSFDEFLAQILEDGRFRWHEWVFPFCYRDLLTRLETLEDTSLVVRSYDEPPRQPLIVDFFSILGLDPEDLDVEPTFQANVRPRITDSVRLFLENRSGRALDPTEQEILIRLCEPADGCPPRISEASAARIAQRFRQSNAEVYRKYGLPEDSMPARADARESNDTLPFEAMFSSQLERSVGRLRALFGQEQGRIVLERDALAARHERLAFEYAAAVAERDTLDGQCRDLLAERDVLRRQCADMRASKSRRLAARMRRALTVLGAGFQNLLRS